MAGVIDARLQELGITLPAAAPPAANYVPYVRTGDLVHVAGQIPKLDGTLQGLGRLGAGVSIAEGAAIARLCGLNLIAQARAACGGDLDRVRRVVKLGGFVCCTPDFTDQSAVINGASDLMVAVFGERGRHARFAVGAPSLPLGVAVEIDAIFEISD
ncbi:MAG: enamine deaminase RidA (YjgF/YER057c/UK114 family) [Myxococcota bacterium]